MKALCGTIHQTAKYYASFGFIIFFCLTSSIICTKFSKSSLVDVLTTKYLIFFLPGILMYREESVMPRFDSMKARVLVAVAVNTTKGILEGSKDFNSTSLQ